MYGKDLVDGLISHSDAMMEEFEKSVGDQLSSGQNRATSLQGQIDLLRSHQVSQDQRINFAVAREAEEVDGRSNERFLLLIFCFLPGFRSCHFCQFFVSFICLLFYDFCEFLLC